MERYKETVAQEIASTVDAWKRCIEAKNDWSEKHAETIEWLQDRFLPSGFGIDSGTTVDADKTTLEKVVLSFSFHHMDENGMYDGWTEHTAIVTPSFYGLDIRITGQNRNDIKDYFQDVFYHALTQVCLRAKEDGTGTEHGYYWQGVWKSR